MLQTFDGYKLFLPRKLDPVSQSVTSESLESGQSVKVHFNFTKQLQLWDRDMIQQFNIIFKRIFGTLKFKMHNRNYYDPANAHSIRYEKPKFFPANIFKSKSRSGFRALFFKNNM
jgi:hypothetical protein